MVERLIETIKHGITVMSILQENVSNWDLQLFRVLFEALHGFWKWWVLQGTSVNKKSDLLKTKHHFFLFFVW
jgi:hypothetical protein